ncbi:MAG TPA: glycosyltransferase family 4 protein [Methanobacteriaceae archaeon]|nr:glycosyltransferase family 4 protein [Methanobacteriaceae archaeon]
MHVNFTLMSTSMSGGARAIFEIANGLVRRGHKVTITSLDGDHSWFPIEAEIIYVDKPKFIKLLNPVKRIKSEGSLTYRDIGPVLEKYMGFEPELLKPLAEAIPDCDINVATWFLTSFAVFRSGKGNQFYFFQDFDEIVKPLGYYYTKMFEESLYLPLKVITGSNWLKNWIEDNYEKKAIVSGYGIEHQVFYPRNNVLAHIPQPKIMGIFRGLDYKGNNDLIQALNIASEHVNNLHLIAVCSRPVFEKLKAENDIKFDYTFFENPDDETLAELYSSADIFGFSSHIEGYGLPPLEAMACGTPVVTTDCLGVRDFVINNENALMTPPKDPLAFSEAILKLLSDKDLYEKIKLNGLVTAEKSTWDGAVDIFESAFLDSLKFDTSNL